MLLAEYEDRANIGGYFAYPDSADARITRCVFHSSDSLPTVIATIAFDSTFRAETADLLLEERAFSELETDLYTLRKTALEALFAKVNGLYKFYEGANPNLIPIIHDGEKKIYILTGPTGSDVVLFGNDYLIRFNDENEIVIQEAIREKLIPVYYDSYKREKAKPDEMPMHLNPPEVGDFITPTDICTLMLYAPYAGWTSYGVVTQKYLNIWDCKNQKLVLLPQEMVEQILEDTEKRSKGKKKKRKRGK